MFRQLIVPLTVVLLVGPTSSNGLTNWYSQREVALRSWRLIRQGTEISRGLADKALELHQRYNQTFRRPPLELIDEATAVGRLTALSQLIGNESWWTADESRTRPPDGLPPDLGNPTTAVADLSTICLMVAEEGIRLTDRVFKYADGYLAYTRRDKGGIFISPWSSIRVRYLADEVVQYRRQWREAVWVETDRQSKEWMALENAIAGRHRGGEPQEVRQRAQEVMTDWLADEESIRQSWLRIVGSQLPEFMRRPLMESNSVG